MDALRLAGIALLSGVVFAVGLEAGHVYKDKMKYTAAFTALISRLRSLIEFDRGELAELYPACTGGDTAPLAECGFLADASERGWDDALEAMRGARVP